jgi:peptide/nickel transport system permease protein
MAVQGVETGAPRKPSGFAGRLRSNRKAVAGAALAGALVLAGLLAPWIAPNDPLKQSLPNRLCGPCAKFPLGADHLGRCILSRLMYGTRVSLLVAVAVVLVTLAIGAFLGLVAGYFGGIVDRIVTALVDLFLAFPGLILMIVLAGILGQGVFSLLLVLCLEGWKGACRIVRSVVLAEKEKEFVLAARALGASQARVIFRHVLPGCLQALLVVGMLSAGNIILATAGMGFLGLGLPPPTPEWGSMINDGRFFLRTAPGLTVWPGLAILVTILAFNVLGEGLQEVLNPRIQS